ncbi:MAG: hypothetical protein KUG64_02445 [Cycloclasticus sp.]|nr:hypothetical protein [Cycloclasticus sp.]
MEKKEVVDGIKQWTKWWIGQRRKKLENELSDTMSVNPFMAPFLFDYHDLKNFEEYVDLIMASHLVTGHNTGFGKLVDEKFLPNVFSTTKLDSAFRRSTKPFGNPCFDEIDHIIKRADGSVELLSLKAGRWTIQLTMAVQLNMAFNEILGKYPDTCSNIVVGVFYGKKEGLTDKYDILRGINRGANHEVIDLTGDVSVYAGKEFWEWLSGGNKDAQDWVLEGIKAALDEEEIHKTSKELLDKFRESVASKYDRFLDGEGKLDAFKLLAEING